MKFQRGDKVLYNKDHNIKGSLDWEVPSPGEILTVEDYHNSKFRGLEWINLKGANGYYHALPEITLDLLRKRKLDLI